MQINNRSLALALALYCSFSHASELTDDFYNAKPRVQLYMAYAEFKMANYSAAEAMWQHIQGPARAEAAFNLGILYEQGLGVEADMDQALTFYLQGADAGSRAAAYQLGLIYLNTRRYADIQRAEHWLTIAALDGDSDAAELLTQFTQTDQNQPQRETSPLSRIRTLIVQGQTEQAVALLEQLTQNTPPDYRAVTRLAWLYETGIGVERDIDRAATLFRTAAEAGEAEAQYALAVMLQTGIGQVQDSAQARQWLQRSADQGYPQALQKLHTPE